MIDVLVPVLGRPARALPLAQSLLEVSEYSCRLLFIANYSDTEQATACVQALQQTGILGSVLVAPWEPGPGDYARKINLGYRKSEHPWLLLAADDLCFHSRWDSRAVRVGTDQEVGVVGTNDLGNPRVLQGDHATHPLIARWYIDRCGGSLDGPGIVYHEGYDHTHVDTELCELAQARGCYAHCHDAVIEHLHPIWGKGDPDATYAKGGRAGVQDAELFEQRRRAWIT